MNYLCCDTTETKHCSPIRQRALLAGHAPTCTRKLNGTLNVLTPPGTSRREARRRSVPTVASAPPSDNGTTVSVAMDVCIVIHEHTVHLTVVCKKPVCFCYEKAC